TQKKIINKFEKRSLKIVIKYHDSTQKDYKKQMSRRLINVILNIINLETRRICDNYYPARNWHYIKRYFLWNNFVTNSSKNNFYDDFCTNASYLICHVISYG